jgi:hypothetical protein
MARDIAERRRYPGGFGQLVKPCGRVRPGGQDLSDATVAEPGDLGRRFFVGGRSCQTPIRPVLGDSRQVRHHVTDRPARTGRNGVLHATSSSPDTNATIRSLVS